MKINGTTFPRGQHPTGHNSSLVSDVAAVLYMTIKLLMEIWNFEDDKVDFKNECDSSCI
jgi:hypothetical protein